MSRRRKFTDSTPFDTLRLEGTLFVPELLERAARGEAAHQKEADYGVPKGLKLHDEYGRAYRIAAALWHDFAPQLPRNDLDNTRLTRTFVTDLLRDCLGFTDLALCPAPLDANGQSRTANSADSHSPLATHHSPAIRSFPVTALAIGGTLPVIIAPHHLGLDDPDPSFAILGSGARRKSAHQLAQEFLNAQRHSLWAIVTNGRRLRLLRHAESLTRPNFLEFDLETILREGEDRYADFSALWRILHASRAGQPPHSPLTIPHSPPNACVWEQWKSEGHAQGLRIRDGLRSGVTEALLILGKGFLTHPDNISLRQQLHDGTLTKENYFQQLLRLIYRSLFLFCAEERDLLHPPDPPASEPRTTNTDPNHSQFTTHHSPRLLYASGYSLRRLRSRSLRQKAHDPHTDLWLGQTIVFRALASGQPRLALPALGGLFAPSQCPGLDSSALTNRDFLAAIRHLRWSSASGTLTAIDYRNMGPEELGSVYESLLELVPQLDLPARSFGFAGITDSTSTSGNARKTSGSYYTPDSLVQELIKSALDPVIADRLAEAGRMANSEWPTLEPRWREIFTTHHSPVPTHHSPNLSSLWEKTPLTIRHSLFATQALLSLSVCDPSCGSGHFLLAAARRLAEKLAEIKAPDGAVRPDDYRHALREVASRCLYGVDLNPMAVELCRVALWLETVDPGKPLGFLNHHIRSGNSLLGTTPDLIAAGLPDETFTAIEGDDKSACAELKKRNKKEREGFGPLFEKEEQAIRDRLRLAATQLEAMDDSQPAALQQKEAAFSTSESTPEYRHAKLLADLWCAAFVIKKTYPVAAGDSDTSNPKSQIAPIEGHLLHTQDDLFGQPTPTPALTKKAKQPRTKNQKQGTASGITTGTLRDFVQGRALPEALEKEVTQLASQYRFFHWHLALPHVFDQGGFDCILGNPPWERVKLQEKEWFAGRLPHVASASNAAARKRLILALESENPDVYQEWLAASRMADAESLILRQSGLYPFCGKGDVNTYALFAEQNRMILSERGYSGFVVPTGIATDEGTSAFFSDLVDRQQLSRFESFENFGVTFAGVNNRQSFSFIVFSRLLIEKATLCFHVNQDIGTDGHEKSFQLKASEFRLLNPNTGTCPTFRSARDAEINLLIYRRVAVLWSDHGSDTNPWSLRFLRMFDMANDSGRFWTRENLETSRASRSGNTFTLDGRKFVPLMEAKMAGHFDHRFATLAGKHDLDGRISRKFEGWYSVRAEDPNDLIEPQYWINDAEVMARMEAKWKYHWVLGWRDICRSTDRRTFVASLIPCVGVGHKFPLLLPVGSPALVACFYASLCSFAFDYTARQKVGGASLTYFFVKQLPVLPPATYAQPCPWASHPESEIPNPPSLRDWLLPRVLELTYTAWDLEAFAADCLDEANEEWGSATEAEGYLAYWQKYSRHSPLAIHHSPATTHHSPPPFQWDEERRFLLRCELDAAFFHLYLGPESEWGVGDAEGKPDHSPFATHDSPLLRAFPTPRHAVSYIMDTFPIVKRKDEAKHGHYRTKDTILQIYDALSAAIQSGQPYKTLLHPPPADPSCCHPPRAS